MHHQGIELCDPFHGDPIPLLDGERVVCRLEFNERANTPISKMNSGLQVYSVWIRLQGGVEPSKKRTRMGAYWFLKEFNPFGIALFAQ
jgi:hypothetical protein